jgi:hypothetical protein
MAAAARGGGGGGGGNDDDDARLVHEQVALRRKIRSESQLRAHERSGGDDGAAGGGKGRAPTPKGKDGKASGKGEGEGEGAEKKTKPKKKKAAGAAGAKDKEKPGAKGKDAAKKGKKLKKKKKAKPAAAAAAASDEAAEVKVDRTASLPPDQQRFDSEEVKAQKALQLYNVRRLRLARALPRARAAPADAPRDAACSQARLVAPPLVRPPRHLRRPHARLARRHQVGLCGERGERRRTRRTKRERERASERTRAGRRRRRRRSHSAATGPRVLLPHQGARQQVESHCRQGAHRQGPARYAARRVKPLRAADGPPSCPQWR